MPWQDYISPVILMLAIFLASIILGMGDTDDS